MIKNYCILLLLLFFAIPQGLPVAVSQAPIAAPYIHYYSMDENAFVIERGDGKDHLTWRDYPWELDLLGRTPLITGAGWSPSQTWFAQASAPDQIILTQKLSKNDIIITGQDARWSPTGDVLAYTQPVDQQICLSDFAQIPHVEYCIPQTNHHPYYRWSDDGSALLIVQIVDNKYEIQITTPDQINLLVVTSPYSTCNTLQPRWLDATHMAYLSTENSVTIFDTETQTGETITADTTTIYRAFISPTQTHLLLETGEDCSTTDETHLVLVDLAIPDFLQVLADAQPRIPADATTQPIRQEINFAQADLLWLPDGSGFVYGQAGHLWIYDIQADSNQVVETPTEGQLGEFQWVDDELVFLWHLPNQTELYAYNLTDHALRVLVSDINTRFDIFALSADRHYAAIGQRNGRGWIVDLTSQASFEIELTQSELLAQIDSRLDLNAWAFEWHPTQNWLFTLSSGIANHSIGIVSADGQVQRQLGLCPLESVCFGWWQE